MSDSTTPTMPVTIGAHTVQFGPLVLAHTKRVDDPSKPGKKMTVPAPKEIIAPHLTSVNDAKNLFVAIIDFAEAAEAGNGLKLAGALFNKRFEDADDAAFNRTTGSEDLDLYIKTLTSPERPRSGGLSIEDINKDLVDYALELGQLAAVGGSADGWTHLKDVNGNAMFSSQGGFILRLSELSQKVEGLQRILEEKQAKSEANKKTRAEKAEKAKAAALAAGSAAVQG